MTTPNDLSTLNSSTLGAEFPEITLPDGSKVQTGTVGALLLNIKQYDTLTASLPNVPATRPGDRQQIMTQIQGLDTAFKTALPLLFKVGLFDLFPPEQWITGGSPGRKRVGELAEQYVKEQHGQ